MNLCHPGLDPVSSVLLESRFRGTDAILLRLMSMCIAWKTCFEPPNFELFTLFFEAIELFAGHPKPSFPGLVIRDGFQQFSPVEIGPEGFRHIQFCIGNLPEKEVGDTEFATRPDEKIRV